MKRLLFSLLFASSLDAQETRFALLPGQLAERGPRFLLATREKSEPVPLDVMRTLALKRKLTLELVDVSVREAVKVIARESGLEIAFSDQLLPASGRVNFRASGITVAAALTEVLLDAKVDVVFTEYGSAALVKRPESVAPPAVGTIVGRVTDKASGAPVSGAVVSVTGTRLGTLSDDQGRFRIAGVSDGSHTVAAQRIGYKRVEATVVVAGAEVTVDFALERTATVLEAVVSTATGAQRSVELGHAVGLVAMDSLAKEAPIASLPEALTARVPGVMINAQNGYANTVSPIRIRGLNSFSVSNDPIVIVDGARIESTPSQGTQTTLCGQYATCPSSRLGDLAMDEIASIEVVKGPAAATLYGTDAANGVLVIRTKRGDVGRARWDLFGETGVVNPVKDVVQYNYHAWGKTPTGTPVHCNLVARNTGTGCTVDSVTKFNPLLDSDVTLFGQGRTNSAGVQVSGGVSRFRYFVSGLYDGNLGWMKMPESDQRLQVASRHSAIPDEYVRPDYSRRINFRENVTSTFGEKGELTLSNGVVSSYSRVPVSFAYQSALYGLGYRDPGFEGYYSAYVSRPGDLLFVRDADYVTRYMGSLTGGYRPTSWLSTRATVGYDYSGQRTDFLQRNGEGGNFATFRLGLRTQGERKTDQYSIDAGATATKELRPSLVSKTSIGAQYNRRSQIITALSGSQLPPGAETVAGAAIITGTETHADNVVAGAFLEEALAWRDRLFVTGAIRTDGSSSFGKNLHTQAYPKFSVSWLASEEPFVPQVPGITSLRLRFAYGASAVQPPSTAGITRLTLSNAQVGPTAVPAALPLFTGFGNPNVKPERQSEYEGGVDLEGWSGRFRTELTYFSRKSTDALVSVPFAASVGAGSYFANIGSVTNKGTEALVTVRPVETRTVALDLTLSGSWVKNKLVSVGSDAPAGFFSILGANVRNRVGYPLYGLWSRPITSYADANNNGRIETSEITLGAEETYNGPGRPTQQLALTTALSFWQERLRLSALIDNRSGYSIFDVDHLTRCLQMRNCDAANNQSASLARQAAIIASAAPFNTSAGYISSGAFTRLREMSLTARIEPRFLKYAGASAGSLTLAGRNLHLWSGSDYLGDPEVTYSGVAGQDAPQTSSTPPLPRTFSVRLNLSY